MVNFTSSRRRIGSAKGMLTLAAVLTAVVAANAADPSAVAVGGMVSHILDSQTATAAPLAAAAPTMQAQAKSGAGASAVLSMLSANGSSNPDLVSEAVSEAGTASPSASTSGKGRAAATTSSKNDDVRVNAAASASASASQPTAWHYAAGAFGCAQGEASGTAYICHATGSTLPAAPSVSASASADAEDTALPSVSAAAASATAITEKRDVDEAFDDVWNKRQSAEDKSGNGGPPDDVLNKDSPDVGWLDLIIGAVPYKNGDLAASIVWILATLILVPLFLVRLLRRSSLIAHVLLTVFIWGCMMLATFGIRAQMSNNAPSTTLMNVENILLQILPCMLIEPLLNLLSLYAQQGGFPSGVPKVALLLRFFNLVALLLYIIGGAYMANWVSAWDDALMDNQQIQDRNDFPDEQPMGITRIGPIVGAFLQVIDMIGALLLIPIARGENGSMRPGGFIAILVLLITIPVVFRVLQTLHAQGEISNEEGTNENPFVTIFATGVHHARAYIPAAANALLDLVPVYEVAPPGMYSPDSEGIDWTQLQQTLASRGRIQSPLVFNLVYIFPQWMMVFLFFFVHAPGHQDNNKLAAASMQP